MENFNALGLPQPLISALEKMNFATPTPIQAQAIPHALEGRDILGSAQTGTGKTAAFSIPLITHLINNPQSLAIVMTPTRELAAQVLTAMSAMLVDCKNIRTALLIGGESMYKQLNQLKNRPRIIVGTPGRINDHLERRSLNLTSADFLVLDETDRMLDMGFGVQIDRVLSSMPGKRQTLLFSATLPPNIVKVAERYMSNPMRVAAGEVNAAVKKINQEIVRLTTAEKYNTLLTQLGTRQGSVIVFVKTKRGADRMAKKLMEDQHSAAAIHGNLNQGQRNRVIQAFRDKRHRIMVATDVAARGLDIPHIEHVINYDLPQVAEDYIHRIGRTARAGAEGAAVCFVTPEDFEMWGEIDQLLNPGAPREHRPQRGRTVNAQRSGKPATTWKNNKNGYMKRKGGYNAEHNRDGGNNRQMRDGAAPRREEGGFRKERPAFTPARDTSGDTYHEPRRTEGRSEGRGDAPRRYEGGAPRRAEGGFRREENNRGYRHEENNGGSRREESNGGFRREESNGFRRRDENGGGYRRREEGSAPRSEGFKRRDDAQGQRFEKKPRDRDFGDFRDGGKPTGGNGGGYKGRSFKERDGGKPTGGNGGKRFDSRGPRSDSRTSDRPRKTWTKGRSAA
ncbi:MAG: DEAD/DEAH box helicase [Micavibrio sp.]|nr:DEAD/DEAH box helicase [Micavibrio sp.]